MKYTFPYFERRNNIKPIFTKLLIWCNIICLIFGTWFHRNDSFLNNTLFFNILELINWCLLLLSFSLLIHEQFLFISRSVKIKTKIEKVILQTEATENTKVQIFFSYTLNNILQFGDIRVTEENFKVGNMFEIYLDNEIPSVYSNFKIYQLDSVIIIQFLVGIVAIVNSIK